MSVYIFWIAGVNSNLGVKSFFGSKLVPVDTLKNCFLIFLVVLLSTKKINFYKFSKNNKYNYFVYQLIYKIIPSQNCISYAMIYLRFQISNNYNTLSCLRSEETSVIG